MIGCNMPGLVELSPFESHSDHYRSTVNKTCLKGPLKKKTKNCFSKTNYRLMQVKSFAECSKRGHSKRPKILVFKTNGSLMQVKSIAECSKRAFCNTFDLH